MLAVNQPNFDIIHYLIKKKSDNLIEKDDLGFDVFTYLLRNNSIVLFFYFLNHHMRNQLY